MMNNFDKPELVDQGEGYFFKVSDGSQLFFYDSRPIEKYQSKQHPGYLFGHSMSTAILLAAADRLQHIAGAILVNPPYRQKEVKGMAPGFGQYVNYAGYFIFAKHTPVVNMAEAPSQMAKVIQKIMSSNLKYKEQA